MKTRFHLAVLLFLHSFISSTYAYANQNLKMPLPYGGIKVVPLSEMSIPESMKKQMLLEEAQLNEKGFVEFDDAYPRQLLSKKYEAASEIKSYAKNTDPLDTHLKANIADIKLAFTYKGSPPIATKKILGYAAVGMWKKTGWTGVVEFFDHKIMGTCIYTLNNIALTGGSELIPAEFVRYDINKKPTTISVKGSYNSGFMYEISWSDKNYFYDLECANTHFSQDITDKMIIYAKAIDKG